MLKSLAALTLILGTFVASASNHELDQVNLVTDQGPQGTVVIRVDQRDGSVSMIQSDEALTSEAQAMNLINNSEFKKVEGQNLRAELDQEAGSSSWYYVYTPYYGYYNCLNWYGYNYYPYYSYNYGYYNYYYYGWYNRWWW